MTRDEIVALARLADVPEYDDDDCEDGVRFEAGIGALERFAAVVSAAEREACAKLCESMATDDLGNIGGQCFDCAEAIRARST